MKQLIVIIFCMTVIFGSYAQKEQSRFLFSEYRESTVLYKDGREFRVPVNYNLYSRNFLFLDKQDNNLEKEFAEPDLVASILIGERIFLPTKNGATEVLQQEPAILVQYRGKLREEGKMAAYGGRSETGSIRSYSSIQSSGITHQLETEGIILTGIQKTYRIARNGKKLRFSGESQFLKIYSGIKQQLKQYIKENKIDFDSTEQVVGLFNYAESLSK